MKKIIAAIIFISVVPAASVFAQALLNTDKYFSAFSIKAGDNISDNDYVGSADNESYEVFAKLDGKDNLIDTNLEFALLSYYSPSVVNTRPARANNLLPANNARASGLKLGAAVYKELTEMKFFNPDDTAAAGRYEEMLQYICGKGSITRQQIEQYFRNGIKSLITEIVDEEFNKISFSITNLSERRMYYMTLIRNPQSGRYTLNYEVPSVKANVKTISAAAREALINEMRRKTEEFSQSDIETVRSQAALIPAVAFPASVRTDVVNVINAFYLNPNKDTYNALDAKWHDLSGQKEGGQAAASSFSAALTALNDAMASIGK